MLTIENNLKNAILILETKKVLKPISLHDTILSKCALIFAYYPMKKSKLDIYLTLDKKQRVGMLYRHIVGVASKLGVYQTILREIIRLRQEHKKYKKYMDKEGFYKDIFTRNEMELSKRYNLLLDIMIEELTRRSDPKYLRKKKLKEIKENLQN